MIVCYVRTSEKRKQKRPITFTEFFLPQSDQYALLIKQHNRHGISGCESHSIHEANICESPHEVIFSFLNLHCRFNPFMVQPTIVIKVADIMDSSL